MFRPSSRYRSFGGVEAGRQRFSEVGYIFCMHGPHDFSLVYRKGVVNLYTNVARRMRSFERCDRNLVQAREHRLFRSCTHVNSIAMDKSAQSVYPRLESLHSIAQDNFHVRCQRGGIETTHMNTPWGIHGVGHISKWTLLHEWKHPMAEHCAADLIS